MPSVSAPAKTSRGSVKRHPAIFKIADSNSKIDSEWAGGSVPA